MCRKWFKITKLRIDQNFLQQSILNVLNSKHINVGVERKRLDGSSKSDDLVVNRWSDLVVTVVITHTVDWPHHKSRLRCVTGHPAIVRPTRRHHSSVDSIRHDLPWGIQSRQGGEVNRLCIGILPIHLRDRVMNSWRRLNRSSRNVLNKPSKAEGQLHCITWYSVLADSLSEHTILSGLFMHVGMRSYL